MSVLERLRTFLSSEYDSGEKKIPKLSRVTGIPDPQLRQWKGSEKKPGATPKVDSIEVFCSKANISANWLVLGVGPEKLSDCRPGEERAGPGEKYQKENLEYHDELEKILGNPNFREVMVQNII